MMMINLFISTILILFTIIMVGIKLEAKIIKIQEDINKLKQQEQ
jgi:hypothetical protein